MTPLMIAAQAGREGAVKALLKFDGGADLAIASSSVTGFTAVHFAAQEGHVEVLRILLRQSCPKDGGSKPHTISSIEKSPSPDHNIPPALHLACHGGHAPVVELLLSSGFAHASILDGNGDTALHSASRLGRLEVALILLATEHGRSSVHILNKRGQLPVDQADGPTKEVLMKV